MPKILVGEIQVHYQMTGAGPPLLFIHGIIHGLGSGSRDGEKQTGKNRWHFFSKSIRSWR